MWKPGDVIAGQYEVRQVFSSGGMGEVYRVHHRDWDMDLALKRPRLSPSSAQESVCAFRRECELWANLNLHPHVVTCYYVRIIDGIPCLLTEYVDGGSLRDGIQSRRLYAGTTEAALARILDISIQSAWGLEYAHTASLVHQDVKPGNILVTTDGTAKVTDFGLARTTHACGPVGRTHVASAPDLCASVNGMTPAYCSPEQARMERVSSKTDIYSWAVSVLEMFRGDVTWAAGAAARYALLEARDEPTPASIPEMPEALFDLLAQCMEESSEARPNGFPGIADRLQTIFLDVFGEPHDRAIPDTGMSEADSLNNRALSLLDLGHVEDAERLLDGILKQDPFHPEALFNVSLLGLNLGQVPDSEALRAVAKLVEHEPGLWGGWFLLAQMQFRVGMNGDALQSMEAALGRVSDVVLRQTIMDWKRKIAEDEPVIVPFAVARPRSGAEYYEQLRKFERLCAKMQRALTTGHRADACRYLQQAQDMPSFRNHLKLKMLTAEIVGDRSRNSCLRNGSGF